MGKSAPSAPDPYAAAQAQYTFGTQAAAYNKALNAPNTVGPTGSTSSQVIGYDPMTGAPQYGTTTTLTAPEQELLAGTQRGGIAEQKAGDITLGQYNTLTGQPLANIPTAPNLHTTMPNAPSNADVSGIQQDAFKTALAGEQAANEPALQEERRATESRLINSGNGPGTPAYDNEMARLDARQASVRTQEAGAAESVGTGLEAQRFGESATGFQQQIQQLTEENKAMGMSEQDALAAAQAQMQQRGSLIGQAGALYGGGTATIPSSSGIPSASAAAPDFMSALQNQYQGQLAQYNANVGTTDASIGAAGALAAALIASDERVKKDKEHVGETPGGIPLYRFRYKGEPKSAPKRTGVMAQQLERMRPDAVHEDARGVKFVDYSKVA